MGRTPVVRPIQTRGIAEKQQDTLQGAGDLTARVTKIDPSAQHFLDLTALRMPSCFVQHENNWNQGRCVYTNQTWEERG